ncbi:ATP-synthase delta chain [Rhodotorula toruloides]|uniref:ATP synthase subunit delta, mitochondrial n=1 Tax=Rhodotorula toruloides TaxID=5286 RepID=A0A511KCK0_RHOTO|nr:ATP-synthase delta chain [Rhodotorula toruloides]
MASLALSALRRAALPRSAALVAARRGYAEAAASQSDKLRLSLVLPHETIYQSQDVVQVNLSAESGDLGVLANHVPTIEALKPGVLEVVESNESKKWFVSGGFANVHPNNTMTVNAVEAYPLDAFSSEAIRSHLAEAQRVASGNGTDEEKAEAAIEVQVYEALQAAIKA